MQREVLRLFAIVLDDGHERRRAGDDANDRVRRLFEIDLVSFRQTVPDRRVHDARKQVHGWMQLLVNHLVRRRSQTATTDGVEMFRQDVCGERDEIQLTRNALDGNHAADVRWTLQEFRAFAQLFDDPRRQRADIRRTIARFQSDVRRVVDVGQRNNLRALVRLRVVLAVSFLPLRRRAFDDFLRFIARERDFARALSRDEEPALTRARGVQPLWRDLVQNQMELL